MNIRQSLERGGRFEKKHQKDFPNLRDIVVYALQGFETFPYLEIDSRTEARRASRFDNDVNIRSSDDANKRMYRAQQYLEHGNVVQKLSLSENGVKNGMKIRHYEGYGEKRVDIVSSVQLEADGKPAGYGLRITMTIPEEEGVPEDIYYPIFYTPSEIAAVLPMRAVRAAYKCSRLELKYEKNENGVWTTFEYRDDGADKRHGYTKTQARYDYIDASQNDVLGSMGYLRCMDGTETLSRDLYINRFADLEEHVKELPQSDMNAKRANGLLYILENYLKVKV